ncbi:PAS domain-containing methyl-accepting chemotaxis protein [Shinella sp. S4-D37]|uniref:methyl-accepting chemotaxis protein n=1 Tax=Shinella sp. S4-D37 TaxID=3161999 RepID=UPI00346782CB
MTLDHVRRLSTIALCAIVAILAFGTLTTDWAVQGSFGLASALAVAGLLGVGATYAAMRQGDALRLMVVTVLMAEIVALLIAARGHPWQTDIHMAFFAALAISALMYDIRVILLGAALVAVHHLGLGMSLDTLVFYGGGSLGRVVLHAVILVLETVALVWMIEQTHKLLSVARDNEEQARTEADKATGLVATALDAQGKIAAISRAQAVIEFTPEGEILNANENFLSTLGYQLAEIAGRHHRMFVEPAYQQSPDYAEFWHRLRSGEFVAEEFKRIGKGGRDVWIQASYNPIFDKDRNVIKVVKFATDITGRVHAVNEIGAGLGQVAAGNLTCEITEPFIPALDTLRRDFNNSVETLRSALQTVAQNASSIDGAAGEVSSAANDLAKRTEHQAASVEETAAALNQITTTVSNSAKRAEEAGSVVTRTRASAEKSGAIVQQAVTTMGEIERSSRAIGSITDMMDEIAFQTNLLALNAGVEAARAGEAGKGFAVVAQEVRELAQRSASAAKEIKALIAKSDQEVKSGVTLVAETGEALQTIIADVQEISGHVLAIVEASREQSTAIGEINTAVSSIDQGTQQNAAIVEETSAASGSLASQAEQLKALLANFRLEPGREGLHRRLERTSPARAA